MALPTLDATFASAADLPRRMMLAKWLVEEKGETQAPSSVLVSGAGTESSNGTYTLDGQENGRNKYVSGSNTIVWDGINTWLLNDDTEDNITYVIQADVQFPWMGTWDIDNGNEPAPIATEIPAVNPIANYITLPERYLWAKIAVAAGGPKTEADYISLPKQYVWSDIYNAVSGDIAESTVVVSGLSDTQYNGRYVYDGDVGGKPSYRLNENLSIYWFEDSNLWVFSNIGIGNAASESDVAYPWLATDWFDEGIDPTGLVLTPETPNHTDWSEKQALGHIAAAYRGDTANAGALATYIDWPWRYQVASIITAL
jgi:hypothetical protein